MAGLSSNMDLKELPASSGNPNKKGREMATEPKQLPARETGPEADRDAVFHHFDLELRALNSARLLSSHTWLYFPTHLCTHLSFHVVHPTCLAHGELTCSLSTIAAAPRHKVMFGGRAVEGLRMGGSLVHISGRTLGSVKRPNFRPSPFIY